MTGTFTRIVAVAAFIACATPSVAHAQIRIDGDRALAETSAAQPPVTRVQGRQYRCCSAKGAVIGAAIGAGLAVWLSRYCDGSDCGERTVGAAVVVGSLGAAIGAFAGSPSVRGPIVFPIARVRF